MKAVQISETGGPDVLKYVELPTPRPGTGEVLVKAHAIGVSMPEMLVRQGVYAWMPPLPLIPGIEMSGTVVETGSGCSRLRVGQKVFVCAREFKERANCYAEYIAGPENRIYAVPDGVDLDEVAGLANYQVAWHLLNSALKGFQYESVLVLAAAGGVGSALVQLARVYGKRVSAVTSSAERAAFVRAQGADEMIDRTQSSVIDETLRLTGGRGVDLIMDCVGGPHVTALFEADFSAGKVHATAVIPPPAEKKAIPPLTFVFGGVAVRSVQPLPRSTALTTCGVTIAPPLATVDTITASEIGVTDT